MYAKIQELKELGMSQNAVAAQLGINRATVRHYWNMSVDEYSKYSCSIRRISILDQYKSIIAGWIMRFPCISSAQICDWLKENYPYDSKSGLSAGLSRHCVKNWAFQDRLLQGSIRLLKNFRPAYRHRSISGKWHCQMQTERAAQKSGSQRLCYPIRGISLFTFRADRSTLLI